jgi:hypothetical protein
METTGQGGPYNFKVVFGFTDSTFFANVSSEEKIKPFIQDCKDRLGLQLSSKTYFYNKKNRFLAWTGNEKEAPIIKGLNGVTEFDPLWVNTYKRCIYFICHKCNGSFFSSVISLSLSFL